MRLGLDVDYLAESDSIRMNITRVNQESLVIGISVSGKTEEVIEGLREAKVEKRNENRRKINE